MVATLDRTPHPHRRDGDKNNNKIITEAPTSTNQTRCMTTTRPPSWIVHDQSSFLGQLAATKEKERKGSHLETYIISTLFPAHIHHPVRPCNRASVWCLPGWMTYALFDFWTCLQLSQALVVCSYSKQKETDSEGDPWMPST